MKTVASAVEQYIKSKPFLQTALSQGIINLTSLARVIRKDIQSETTTREVRNGAIVMALKRLSVDMEFRSTHRIVKILKNIGDIIVRSNLTDYTFLLSDTFMNNQAELLQKIRNNKDAFYAATRGVNETNLIVSSTMESLVEDIFKKERLLHKFTNLGAISVKLPEENISVPGIYYFIFQRLAWEGVSMNEVISTANEFTIVIPEYHVDIAFKVIKDLKLL
ncbi:aspartate kinase [Capnocytophaga genosp. AHN8471]|uniref:Aspartate kinase n=1 Tax=Capnocytophaga genosp. AHN8471 TaxID=327574 RepID=A0ABS1YUD2_9FLAO|nr:aspartate kinase [Capnocytophaga genosp. AHN8471]MBM0649862.1 aspartate kinase [Capnocytophaga genosp. AHN8471]MBM0655697.1 aspartate kinase [Capnocytophaga genosp. AHN8471]MBM0662406.1 aspartate kinase [Capnocytophaga genosp. AHN8471]